MWKRNFPVSKIHSFSFHHKHTTVTTTTMMKSLWRFPQKNNFQRCFLFIIQWMKQQQQQQQQDKDQQQDRLQDANI